MIIKCKNCKKEFYIRPFDYKRNRRCCSRKCGYLQRKSPMAENHPNWKGDKVKYAGLHIWVKKRKPKLKYCENCKKSPPYDLANKGIYNRELKNWKWLCRRCHLIEDGRMIKNLKPLPRKGKYTKCPICRKEVYRMLSQVKKRNFCSLKCLGLYQRNKINKERKI